MDALLRLPGSPPLPSSPHLSSPLLTSSLLSSPFLLLTSLSFSLNLSFCSDFLLLKEGCRSLDIVLLDISELILTKLIQYNTNIYSCLKPLPFLVHVIHKFKLPLPKQYYWHTKHSNSTSVFVSDLICEVGEAHHRN